MSGNVLQWCRDWLGNYPGGALTDPAYNGAASGDSRVFRGGSCFNLASVATVIYRSYYYPYIQRGVYGFRVVRP